MCLSVYLFVTPRLPPLEVGDQDLSSQLFFHSTVIDSNPETRASTSHGDLRSNRKGTKTMEVSISPHEGKMKGKDPESRGGKPKQRRQSVW